MSRHTTSFTTDPIYRARMELHDRLGRIRDEAVTTASAMEAFPGNESEAEMWQVLEALCQGYINGIDAINEAERQNKHQAASAARHLETQHRVGQQLLDFLGEEPA